MENNDDYDSPWKEAIEQYFLEFMAFYFHDAYNAIDWSQNYVFLDQELRAVMQDAELGKRFVDKLIRVTQLNGDENWVYIHTEVQGSRQAEFAERMFVYNYRLFDRYRRPIASMAVLADEQESWKPNSYGFEVFGCEHRLTFPIAKLTDYHEQLEALLASENAFAFITAAHILTRKTRKHYQVRYDAKLRLVRLLYQRQWDRQRIINLFAIIDWLMALPEGLNQQLWHEIEAIEESKQMQYITSVERIGIAKGRMEGRLEGETRLLVRQLERRFGVLPIWVADKLHNAHEQDLEAWADAVLVASSLEAVFEYKANH